MLVSFYLIPKTVKHEEKDDAILVKDEDCDSAKSTSKVSYFQ